MSRADRFHRRDDERGAVNYSEKAVVFDCDGEPLIGVLSIPPTAARRGVVIVVGGPQYRAGSHRQFTLLARALADGGRAVLRFDYRGMGDSGGDPRTFESVNRDLRAAVDCLCANVPEVKDVAIWGLCDAASAALFYAPQDARITGMVLVNPWVRTVQGEARAHVKHYYVARLGQPAFWRKLVSGQLEIGNSVKSFLSSVRAASQNRESPEWGASDAPLPERMRRGLAAFNGRVLLILSGDDLTAQEFKDLAEGSDAWRKLLSTDRVQRHDMPRANHTFSRRAWRDEVAAVTGQWLQSWGNAR
jgi:uncharacterized protein